MSTLISSGVFAGSMGQVGLISQAWPFRHLKDTHPSGAAFDCLSSKKILSNESTQASRPCHKVGAVWASGQEPLALHPIMKRHLCVSFKTALEKLKHGN